MVSEPLGYPWSSYSSFVGKTKWSEWLETGGLLGHFGRKLKESIGNYKSYVEEFYFGQAQSIKKRFMTAVTYKKE